MLLAVSLQSSFKTVMSRPRVTAVLAAVTLVVLSGCASTGQEIPGKCWMDRREILSRIDMKSVMDEAAKALCMSNVVDQALPLLAPDFVDIHTYKSDSVGLVMGEYFRAGLTGSCGHSVRQADLSKDFRLNSQGFTALTRNPSEVRSPEISAHHAMVGVYNWQENKLAFVLRQIAIETSTVQRVVTKEVFWRCETSHLGQQRLTWTLR
jgi:hypothetical protein